MAITNPATSASRSALEWLDATGIVVGFSSKEDPEIAVVVFVEHGGKGGIAAAPLAREIFEAFYDKGK